jgi:hypothetical protein
MKMEPHVVVITHSPVSRVASLLREAGYLVTKSTPELAGSQTEAEALIVDLQWFELVLWLDEQIDDDRILLVTPTAASLKSITARTICAMDIEDDLVSAVDRIVADQRIAAYRRQPIVTTPAYNPLTSFLGAMAR